MNVGLVVGLLLCGPGAYAEDEQAQITRQQERLEKLSSEFDTSQRRLLAQKNVTSIQEITIHQLGDVSDLLSKVDREFTVLTQVLMLESLVTEARFKVTAKKIVDLQKRHLASQSTGAKAFAEKTLGRAADEETSRLLLEARDLFKSSAELVEGMRAIARE